MAEPAGAGGVPEELERCFGGLAAIGRDPSSGGYRRFAWTPEDGAARDWFRREAAALGLSVEQDGNGNLWAWWDRPAGSGGGTVRDGALVLGSHLDTVADGGAYDGALGLVSALVAVGLLRARGWAPSSPVAVVAFADEEGGRFGLATVGSRLLAGSLDPGAARDARDAGGATMAAALDGAGVPPAGLGPDPGRLGRVGAMVELHVEQGRALVHLGTPLGVGSGIWPHGRWRLDLAGQADHAGTTALPDRRDPTLPLAVAIRAARRLAGEQGAVATVGRIVVEPNGTNTVPGRITAWLDARAPDDACLDDLVDRWRDEVAAAGASEGVGTAVVAESRSAAVTFDPALRRVLAECLTGLGLGAPELPTAAGHDAGALAAVVPAAMLFVRNRTGVSHSPAESADPGDCVAGVEALAAVVERLAGR
ncbi:MAG: allantoate amidohydrolase [Acidimicrobiales bacterium]